MARLRSRISWLQEGDANTSFFHLHAVYRSKKKFIAKLQHGDQIATSQDDKLRVIHDFFDGLLGSAIPRTTTLNLDFFHREPVDLSSLDEPFSENEVWDTIKQLPADKAPGPDGYTGLFYRCCWGTIKADFMVALLVLHQGDGR